MQESFYKTGKWLIGGRDLRVNLEQFCHTSQLKYVFRLEETVSHAVGQKSLTPYNNNNMNFRLAHDQVVLLDTAANFCEPAREKQRISSQFFLVLS